MTLIVLWKKSRRVVTDQEFKDQNYANIRDEEYFGVSSVFGAQEKEGNTNNPASLKGILNFISSTHY